MPHDLDTRIPELVAAYEAGATAQELAARYGVSKPTVLLRLRAAGVVRTTEESRALRARRPRDCSKGHGPMQKRVWTFANRGVRTLWVCVECNRLRGEEQRRSTGVPVQGSP